MSTSDIPATQVAPDPAPDPAPVPAPMRTRRIAVASLIGTSLEWFDFLIYGTAAALVLGPQFFPSSSPLAQTLAAFSTLLVGFVARPIGAALLGNLGDRIGRRKILILSLVMMGGSTALIGLLPNFAAIGVAAPILLVALRLVQGLGVGGEWGGAVLMAMEHAPPKRRVLYSAFPQMGLPIGLLLASVVFLPLQVWLAKPDFQAWGWRIPFLVSALLVVYGLILRRRLDETPEFVRAREAKKLAKTPVLTVFRTMPRTILLTSGVSIVSAAFGQVFAVFSFTFVAQRQSVPTSVMLAAILVASAVWAVAVPVSSWLATMYGKRRILLIGTAAYGVWAFPYFLMLGAGSVALVYVAAIGVGVAAGVTGGAQAALIADAFPPALRYSGASIGYAVSGMLGGGLAPLAAASLNAVVPSGMLVATYLVAMALVTVTCVSLIPVAAPDSADTTA